MRRTLMLTTFTSYWDALAAVRDHCPRVETRLGLATQALNIAVRVDPYQMPRRAKMRRELGYMELLQLLTGVFDTAEIARVAPNVNLDIFGASAIYGPRVWLRESLLDSPLEVDQIHEVIEELRRFPQSRRAVISVHNSHDLPEAHPCISSFQFQVLNNYIFCTVNYRSCDLWFGFPHDLVVIAGLTQVIASCLHKVLAPIHVNMANAHVYDKNAEAAGGPPISWWFRLPGYDSLVDWRVWARGQRENLEWTRGAPGEVEELFPKVPALRPYVPALESVL
jgi:hypothetical protein